MIALLLQYWLVFPAWAENTLPEVIFEADGIEYEGVHISGVKFGLSPPGLYRLDLGHIGLKGQDFGLDAVSLAGTTQDLRLSGDSLQLSGRLSSMGIEGELTFSTSPASTAAEVSAENVPTEILQSLDGVPEVLAWMSRGAVDFELGFRLAPKQAPEVNFGVRVRDLSFDSPDGRFAGEGLQLEVSGSLPRGDVTALEVAGSIGPGQLLLDDFYRDFSDGGAEFSLESRWREDIIEFPSIHLSDNHSLAMEGRAYLGLGEDSEAWSFEMRRLDLLFPGAYERYMEPVAAPWTLDGLTVTGGISWSGKWTGGSFSSGNLEVTDLSIVDTQRERFAFSGLDARLRPGDHFFQSELTWRGLLFGRINLGPGRAALDSEPGAIALVQPLILDVLGGRLNLWELKVVLPGGASDQAGEADIHLRADLEALDMDELTAALGWPAFAGKISGEIPGVRLKDGVLDVDGEIRVSVFDGSITLADLRIERPFGVLPSLAANVEAHGLDLGQLTGTFSFGSISGQLDGYVHELRMLDWRPVAFDAWFGTPERQQGSRGISRQAVNHLTTLGGGRATTALTGPVMRLFNDFSYRRLGLGCRLHNNICEIRGLGEDDVSVLIMEGAGVPKIMIRAFNRRVDWPQLVADLAAVSGGESIRVGD